MKNNIISLWVVMAVALSLTACNDDNENYKSPGNPDAELKEAVMGTYAGQASIVADDAPARAAQTEPAAIEAIAGEKAIRFVKFPVDMLVEALVGEENASEIIASIGKIDYSVDYELRYGSDENTLSVSLDADPLEITIPPTPAPHAESPDALTIRVEFASPKNGVYESKSEEMRFSLTVERIIVGGETFEMQPIELTFDLGKVKIEHH